MTTETTNGIPAASGALSDDDLAKLLLREMEDDADVPLTWENIPSWDRDAYLRMARAVRHALLPAVAPLAPGETVTIPWTTGVPHAAASRPADAGDLTVDVTAENSTDAARASHPDAETARSTTPGAAGSCQTCRALAVLDRLWHRSREGELAIWRDNGRIAAGWYDDPAGYIVVEGVGETPAAALLALGARLDEATVPGGTPETAQDARKGRA